jgi:hypothetical protein
MGGGRLVVVTVAVTVAVKLNMHTVERDGALARVRQELPSDATVAWDLNIDSVLSRGIQQRDVRRRRALHGGGSA